MSSEDTVIAGYVVIRVGTHNVHDVRDRLLKIDNVIVAHSLIGPDDLICYLEAGNYQEFREALDSGIRSLVGDKDKGDKDKSIDHTETMLVLAKGGTGYSRDVNRPAPAAAWLFCDVSVGDPGPVVSQLLEIEGVVNAHPVIGRYDVIAYVEAATMDELMRVLDGDVRNIKDIKRTDTRLVLMNVVREKTGHDRTSEKRIGV